MAVDMSSGLPDERDFIVAECPDVPMWSENLLFALWDPHADVAMWLHLGTVPGKWTMWEDRVLVMLPGHDGALSLRAYHHTAPERRPAGPGLEFRQREPWRRWHVTFDGYGLHTPEAEMLAGVSRDGPTQAFAVDLDIECVTPAWDARTASQLESGTGDMDHTDWASEHYEQLVRATGTVTLESGDVAFSGYGWRDHSRGPRILAKTLDAWGGHVILGCVYPESGRAWGLSRYYSADGLITLEGGYVFVNDMFEHARVVTAPRLRELQYDGEVMPVAFESSGGLAELRMECDHTLWTSMQRGLAVGKDLEGLGLMYVLSHGRCEWDGETGYFYSERADQLNALAPEPHHAAP
ncbi:MAG: 6-phosphofructokinase [Acidimicrobiia bacterium]